MCAEACYCSLAAVAAVRFCAPAPLSASQKCLCKQAFLLHGIMCRKPCYRSLAACRRCAPLRTRAIVGFAKMPLQASIFASWYN